MLNDQAAIKKNKTPQERLIDLGLKTLDNLTSTKVYILVASTVFFAIGKMSSSEWISTSLAVAGLRLVNEVGGMIRDHATTKAEAKSKVVE